jgi:hypothetical protein
MSVEKRLSDLEKAWEPEEDSQVITLVIDDESDPSESAGFYPDWDRKVTQAEALELAKVDPRILIIQISYLPPGETGGPYEEVNP